MCGIAGVWSPGPIGSPEAIERQVRQMAEMLRHRGPDDAGSWSDGRVGLGHTRLSIIDLSGAAHQPMVEGATRLIFNGEIYNFVELREQLVARGHRFTSASDTEVILRGYLEWGDGVVARLRGMFAFAIWDGERDRLLLARDRIGQKPLNYGWAGSSLVFGSEIKALLRWPGFRRAANLEALEQYFLFRYVPGTDTAFEGVHRLEAAHYAVVDSSGRMEKHRYWEVPAPGGGPRRDQATLQAELLEHLDEAVRLRMVSDVPLGAFLSGGVDSSAVVASMAVASSEPIKTFTVGFNAAGIDEREHARLVADLYGTDHTEYVIRPDIDAIAHSLAWFYGEPYADEVTIPTYCISAIARRDVTVALNGDGGDESFLGYRRHAASRLTSRLDFVPLPVRRLVGRVGGSRRLLDSDRRPVRNIGKALAAAARTPAERYTDWVTYGSEDLMAVVGSRDLLAHAQQLAVERFAPYFSGDIPAEDAAARADLQALLNENLEVRVDIATMATGLEGRSPFLDHKFIEWAADVPAGQRMRGLRLKSLLKEALVDRVPRQVMYRPKQGFFMDFEFIKQREAMIRDVVLSPAAHRRGVLDSTAVGELIEGHYRGERPRNSEVWMLFVLEQWFQMWIDPPVIPQEPPPTPRLDV